MNELTDEKIENIYLDHRDQLPNIPLIRAIITADRALQASRVAELEAQLEAVGAGGVGAMIPKTIPDRTALIDLIAEHLSGTYHCTRVWSAWRVGTMSQDDFADVSESDTPSEIAEAIIATLISQQIAEPAATDGWKLVPLEPTADMLQAGQDTPVSESDEDAPEDYKAVYRAMLAAAPQPEAQHQAGQEPITQPVQPADDRAAFEVWAKKEGLNLHKSEPKEQGGIPSSRFGLCPATYYFDEAECAWRAWANKPIAPLVRPSPTKEPS